jgi:hypothetical protein
VNCLPVVSAVGKEEKEAIEAGRLLLQDGSPHLSLRVNQPRDRLDSYPSSWTGEDGVNGTAVSGVTTGRNLRLPRPPLDSGSTSGEQLEMATVP